MKSKEEILKILGFNYRPDPNIEVTTSVQTIYDNISTAIDLCKESESVENILQEALEKIENPIKWLQIEAEKNGYELNGDMAIQTSNDANYLKGIARTALMDADDEHNKIELLDENPITPIKSNDVGECEHEIVSILGKEPFCWNCKKYEKDIIKQKSIDVGEQEDEFWNEIFHRYDHALPSKLSDLFIELKKQFYITRKQ